MQYSTEHLHVWEFLINIYDCNRRFFLRAKHIGNTVFITVNTSKFLCGTKKFGTFSLAESSFPFEKDALRQYANHL
jgi:hypothetical protein